MGSQRVLFGGMAQALLLSGLLIAGCSGDADPPSPRGEPVGLQLLRAEPRFKQQRFNVLLGFEHDSDPVFLLSEPRSGSIDPQSAHAGSHGLRLPAGTTRLVVKLTSLLSGRTFPGDWTLAGAYLHAEHPAEVRLSYAVEGRPLTARTVALAPKAWTLVAIDLTKLDAKGSGEIGQLVFDLGAGSSPAMSVDDVVLIDNAETLVGDEGAGDDDDTAPPPPWTIRRRGFEIKGDVPGRFSFTLPTPEASPNGWTVEEVGPLRARFASTGKSKSLTIYSDGRAYQDAEFKPMAKFGQFEDALAAQHQAPAEIQLPEDLGRVKRNARGDANNDGYNESTGAYQLVTHGPRLEFRVLPRAGGGLVRPVIEIEGLPPGDILATVEGRLVDDVSRLDDGDVLIELPVRIERPTEVNVKVQ
ncbi:MAG: hypothetical protein ACREIT_12525 [Tepidisphaeraceae bacterium]